MYTNPRPPAPCDYLLKMEPKTDSKRRGQRNTKKRHGYIQKIIEKFHKSMKACFKLIEYFTYNWNRKSKNTVKV